MRILARRNGRRILFSSDSRAELGGNLKLVYDRMVDRGLDREFELLTLFKPGIVVRRSIRDRLRLPWLLARVDTIVIDDYQPVIYRVNVPRRHDRPAVARGRRVQDRRLQPGRQAGRRPNPYGADPQELHLGDRQLRRRHRRSTPRRSGSPSRTSSPTGIPRMDPMFDAARAQRGASRRRRGLSGDRRPDR